MNKQNLYKLISIIFLVIVAVGLVIAIGAAKKKPVTTQQQPQSTQNQAKSFSVSGVVSKIDGKILTIKLYDNTPVTVTIGADTQIIKLTTTKDKTTSTLLKFSDLKVGNQVTLIANSNPATDPKAKVSQINVSK